MPQPVSGLAASIRNAVESETFDLAGQTVPTIEKSVHDAFGVPFVLSDMIRITLITGAGKLGRQKYDDGAAKAVTTTLRELGYTEDRGASAVMECAGTFKLQHDTGKNLKTVVVFPRVAAVAESKGDNENGEDSGGNTKVRSLLPEQSVEHKIAYSSMSIFQRMVKSMCPSWLQLKGVVSAIDDIKKRLEDLEANLLQGAPLTESEQEFYNSLSISTLEEKNAFVRDLMHKLMESGQITAAERRIALSQIRERLDKLDEDIKEAEKEKKPKRVEVLKAQKVKAEERKDKIEKIEPKPPHALKNEAAIAKLRKELGPLLDMEDAAKGRLLTVKESQTIARKDEILEEIAELERGSRGWFESDAEFNNRVKASLNAWQNNRRLQKNKKTTTPAASKTSSTGASANRGSSAVAPSTKWVTPAAKKLPAPKPQVSKATQGGGVFAAMMMDSDSD